MEKFGNFHTMYCHTGIRKTRDIMKIMILSCGTNASFHFCRRFKEIFKDNVTIIGTDINDPWLVASITYIDQFYKVPLSSDERFIPEIEKIFEYEKPNILISSFDFDQKIFYPESEILKKYNVKTYSTCYKTLKYYDNKKTMGDFLKSHNLPVPHTFNRSEIEDEITYFVKPVNGVGSIGAKCLCGNEIKQLEHDDILIQEVCKKPEYTVECFHYGNNISTICRERIETKAGVCTKARVFNNNELEEICKKMNSVLELPCYYNIQVMKNNNDEYVITDVNLRSAGGMSISYAAGWDVVGAITSAMIKRENDYMKYVPRVDEQYVVRTYTDVVTKKISRIGFDLDGTLLDSRARHIVLLNKLFIKYKINMRANDLIEFKSRGKNNVDYMIHKGIDSKLASTIQKEWVKKIEDYELLKYDKLYPESIDLLKQLSQNNELILITARSNRTNTIKQIKELGIDKYFKHVEIVDVKNVSESKKDVLIKYNIKEYYGDTKADYLAARSLSIMYHHHENGFHDIDYVEGKKCQEY